ncbi:hypothetical protein [Staphylococcus agnetis]|uniref:hypothetical protein n=1 Tax=Staphylococcus agnetis TaxID=985762 RepID=UPI00071F7C0F|nr:hypothetical protein [Staphylococcus agnetis]ALN78156.1 hypothetical protein EP23_12300 [Staphylococcus agnetis]NJI14391.1 hypothetical protein [Staphylococcus agnetis]HEE8876748.1 hypothetical protein [Staphylococcus aureus]
MVKKSLINNVDNNLDNKFINVNQKVESLPQTSLRVKGHTHSKLIVLKKIEMVESVDDVLDKVLNLYIDKYPNEKKNNINQLIDEENEYKIKKARKKRMRSK